MHGRPAAAALRELLSRGAHGKPGGGRPTWEGERDRSERRRRREKYNPPHPLSGSSRRKQVQLCAPPQNMSASQAQRGMGLAPGQPPRPNGSSLPFGFSHKPWLRAAAHPTPPPHAGPSAGGLRSRAEHRLLDLLAIKNVVFREPVNSD